jgi:hypothetical protein
MPRNGQGKLRQPLAQSLYAEPLRTPPPEATASSFKAGRVFRLSAIQPVASHLRAAHDRAARCRAARCRASVDALRIRVR